LSSAFTCLELSFFAPFSPKTGITKHCEVVDSIDENDLTAMEIELPMMRSFNL
jgi:hypothetical protein